MDESHNRPFVETHCSAFLESQRITSASTELHAAHLTKQLREAAVEHLGKAPP